MPEFEPIPLPAPSTPPKYTWQGAWRNAGVVTTAVLHYTGRFSSPQSVIADNIRDWEWVQANPEASAEDAHEAGVRLAPRSFHYIVAKDGGITAFVPHAHVAWHCPGRNTESIGIEHFARKGEALTPEQGAGTVQLLLTLRQLYPNLRYVGGHRFLSSKGVGSTDCPGDLWGDRSNAEEMAKGLRAWVLENLSDFTYIP